MSKLLDSLRSRLSRLRLRPSGDNATTAAPTPREAPETANEDAAKFESARALHQRGQLDEAEALFRALLQKYPNDFDLLHLLGIVQGQRGSFDAAIKLIEQALTVEPNNAAAHCSLGNCLKGLHQHERALASYDRALALQPNDADALNNRGATLRDLKRLEEALDSFDRALAISPNHVTALENRGATLRELKRLAEALNNYDKLLVISPDHAEALLIHGTLLRELQRPAEALASFDKLRHIKPGKSAAHAQYGITLAELKEYDQALASYDHALVLDPNDFGVLCNRGTALFQLKRFDDALACFDRVLAMHPDNVDALINQGATFIEVQRLKDALRSFDKALATAPNLAAAHHNRGIVLAALKRHEEALASFDHALSIQADVIDTKVRRGIALRELGRHLAALSAFDDVLAIEPDHIVANLGRGVSLEELKRYEDALASANRVLELQPDNADAHNNRGTVYNKLRRHDEALASYSDALAINPDHLPALFNRADLQVYARDGEAAVRDFVRLVKLAPDTPYMHGHLLRAKMSCCDWRDLDSLIQSVTDGVLQGKRIIEPFHGVAVFTAPDLLKRCAEIYVADKFPRPQDQTVPFNNQRSGKIRLGYVAGEFRQHATSFLTAELFERHDTSQFELFAFDNGWDDGTPMRKRLEKAFSEIVDVSRLGDSGAVTAIRDRGIDILIDLNGHVGRKRTGIFRQRAAPIQVNWLGFPGTTGAEFMDYIIGDTVLTPEEHDIFYAEKVVRLPDSYQVNDSTRVLAKHALTRAGAGLPESGFVFCSFNDNYKFTPEVFDVWMRLLKQTARSVLWLFEGSAAAARNLRLEAAARGVEQQRIVFAPRMEPSAHLARHQLADLFLDTLPCNAHTTASDALWMGLPLVTCLGSTFAGRVAGSLLHAIGLPELATRNLTDYEALALKLATTPALLSEFRTRLARNKTTHPLFDADRFRRHIESAYITMQERRLRNEAPSSFSVNPIV